MTIRQNVIALMKGLETTLQVGLVPFADELEGAARQESEFHWADDSGSAREALTGYVVGVMPHDKNFQNWEYAQSPGYISPVWKNLGSNFQPWEEDIDQESRVEVILTHFVRYAQKLEDGERGEPPLPGHKPEGARIPLVGGTLANTVYNKADDFQNAVAFILNDAIGP